MSIGECLSKCCISRVQPNLCKVSVWWECGLILPVQGERSEQYSDWGITLITGGKRAKRVQSPELTIHTYRPCLSEVVLCVAIALHRGIHVSRVCFCNLITDVCVETNRHTGLSAASRTYEAEKKRIIKLQKKSYNLYRCRLYVAQ